MGLPSFGARLDIKEQEEMCLKIGTQFPFMPLSQSEAIHPTIKDSVTFFGGSFNPFHAGHLSCLKLCPEKNIIVVLDRNPEKENRTFMPYEEYLKIKEKLLGTEFFIYPAFWGSSKPNPTNTWLPEVKIAEKNLLIGDDAFMHFQSWQKPEIILKAITKLYVVPRIYSKSDCAEQKKQLLKMNSKLDIIFLNEHPHQSMSSSKLR